MAPKPSAPSSSSSKKKNKSSSITPIDPTSSFTPDSFERELRALAAKAKGQTWTNWARTQAAVYLRAATLLTLIAAASTVSQLALSPAYGSIPSARWHAKLVMAACFAGWSSNLFLNRVLAPVRPETLLPMIALWIPVVQFALGKVSGLLTASWGPLVTESVTLFPLVAVSAACVATYLDGADLSALPRWVADAAPGLGSYGFFKAAEKLFGGLIEGYVGRTVVNTRLVMEVVLGAAYALFAPSKLLVWTVPALLHTAFLNTHVPTSMALARLNSGLAPEGYVVLDRAESITGYVSVVDSPKEGYRVLRCDHSLLGGEWVKLLGQGQLKGNQVAEPIYGVFAMLEAVRLVRTPEPIVDSEAKALVIGLGIGTTPAALVAHGIETTVVELDPVVHKFASKYFQLPSNHTAVIEDAVTYTSRLAADASGSRFDYIIHDVFTGGAEPISLFTLEFLQNLHTLLKPNGVVAINYAGDFTLPPPRIVVNTIKSVFPTCRIFREHPRDDADFAKSGRDFTNMVIFCTKKKPSADGEISFRLPTERDLLNSPSRRAFLMPQHEVRMSDFVGGEEGKGILRRNETERLVKWHEMSALGHWTVMRTVLPEAVWEAW
ncbi:S-adenosyl-L-methionine-dependent methyltransferase [Parathielavia appendiculata]|uniref:S-adenosyl-L-methionine-dependent methyltransferase n=1 Tax=Parathielavia appendiculata TaxID=2587402 RepID=A0AAN6YZD7_9PEZI|nr:S-adenosyl-L-methionine-dependent methyltransferase [Parathielavia appendiculata]